MKHRRLSIFTLVWACAALIAPCVACAADRDAAWDARIARWVADLSAADEPTRTAAEDGLLNTPASVIPRVEAAAAKADPATPGGKRLTEVMAALRPFAARRSADEKRKIAEWEANSRTALVAYDRAGKKDPRWDALAIKGIKGLVSRDAAEKVAAVEALKAAIDAGCTDPFVRYGYARLLQLRAGPTADSGMTNTIIGTYREAVRDFQDSTYPADRKCFALVRAVHFVHLYQLDRGRPDLTAKTRNMADAALALAPEAFAEQAYSPHLVVELAGLVLDAQAKCGADRAAALAKVFPALERTFPKGPVPQLVRGQAYVAYAWDARGTGLANTVTPEGWRLMADRLKVAAGALERAYAVDPSDPEAATSMIDVELGLGGDRAEMEKWFHRAIDADPDLLNAYKFKRYYLEPKWHGSAGEMLAFGRECAASRNWYAGVPNVLLDAHTALANDAADKEGYWRQPDVWRDVESVTAPPVLTNPDDRALRSRHAYWACRCGQWKEAGKQFGILGDNVDVAPFGGRAKYESMRKEAAANSRAGGR